MFATWRSGSRAWSPEHNQTIGIGRAARTGQEVTKRRREIWGIFEEFFDLCEDFSLMEHQSQASDSNKDKHCLRWIYDWLGSPKTVCMSLDHW